MFTLKTATKLACDEATAMNVRMVVMQDTRKTGKSVYFPCRKDWCESRSDDYLHLFLVGDACEDGRLQTEWLD